MKNTEKVKPGKSMVKERHEIWIENRFLITTKLSKGSFG